MKKVKCIYSSGIEFDSLVIESFKIGKLDFDICKGKPNGEKTVFFISHNSFYLYNSPSFKGKEDIEKLKSAFIELYKYGSNEKHLKTFIKGVLERKQKLEK